MLNPLKTLYSVCMFGVVHFLKKCFFYCMIFMCVMSVNKMCCNIFVKVTSGENLVNVNVFFLLSNVAK